MRRRQHGEAEDQLHHVLHLTLFGPAVANDRALDLRGRVLGYRQPGFNGCEHCDAARVSELQRAPDVGGVEQILDRDTIGPAVVDQCRQPAMNGQQLFRKSRARGSVDGAAYDNPMARSVRLDAAVTGALGARVDAENFHASEASISFSSMSKFDQTWRTSSCSSSASISLTIC